MRLLLLGRSGSVNAWFEDAGAAFRDAGHDVRLGTVRRPWLNPALERALAEPLAAVLARQAAAFDPALIIAIGGFHAPQAVLRAIKRSIPGRALVGWVGDDFDAAAGPLAAHYDLIGYTDSGFLRRHAAQGFPGSPIYLPHAVNPGVATRPPPARRERVIFVGNPTPYRRQVAEGAVLPLALYGPAWTPIPGRPHEIHPGRLSPLAVRRLYLETLVTLNIRNELHVLDGLNQRNFDPCLMGAALLTDAQPDLSLCFDPDEEVAVWRDADGLNAWHERLLADPAAARALAERARRRVLGHHTFARRLETILAALGGKASS